MDYFESSNSDGEEGSSNESLASESESESSSSADVDTGDPSVAKFFCGLCSDTEEDEPEKSMWVATEDDVRYAQKRMDTNGLATMGRFFVCGCRTNCISKISAAAAGMTNFNMWHNFPSRAERREKYYDAMLAAYRPDTKKFLFWVEKAYICEATYRRVLGLTDQTTQWKSVKRLIISGGSLSDKKPVMKEDTYTSKIDYMRRWITNFASSSCERAPINDHLDDILYVLPFVSVTEFGKEFLFEHKNFASERTFRRAAKKCPNIRYMKCKGSMPTCGICDSIAQLLANTQTKHKLTKLEKKVWGYNNII